MSEATSDRSVLPLSTSWGDLTGQHPQKTRIFEAMAHGETPNPASLRFYIRRLKQSRFAGNQRRAASLVLLACLSMDN